MWQGLVAGSLWAQPGRHWTSQSSPPASRHTPPPWRHLPPHQNVRAGLGPSPGSVTERPRSLKAQPTQAARQHLLQSCLAVWGHGPGDSDFSPPCSTHWGHTEAPRACHSPLGSPSPATSGSTRPRTSGPLPLLFPLPVHCSLEAPALHSLPRLHVSARAPLSEWTSLITPLNTAAPPPHIPLAPLMCVYP